jgi:small subunit ribosomal protein S4e
VEIPKTGDRFRIFYDERRRFTLLKITDKAADKELVRKICKITRVEIGPNKIPYMVTHDARTIRYPDPSIQVGDSILYNFDTQIVEKHFTLSVGHKALVTGGNNLGRVGTIQSIVKKLGNIAVVTLKDEAGHVFNTRVGNVFVIGDSKVACALPRAKGIRSTVDETVNRLLENDAKHAD